jgi:hypothetical protein
LIPQRSKNILAAPDPGELPALADYPAPDNLNITTTRLPVADITTWATVHQDPGTREKDKDKLFFLTTTITGGEYNISFDSPRQ